MNKIFSIFLALLMALSVKGEGANEKYLVPDIPIMNEWIDVNFVHIDFDAREFKIGDLIKRGDLMGHISKYPDTLSLMFDKAYIEISRSLASIQDMKNTNAYSQGLQYLTECAYEMYQDELARYLAKRTLIYDSKNEYARGVIKSTKKL